MAYKNMPGRRLIIARAGVGPTFHALAMFLGLVSNASGASGSTMLFGFLLFFLGAPAIPSSVQSLFATLRGRKTAPTIARGQMIIDCAAALLVAGIFVRAPTWLEMVGVVSAAAFAITAILSWRALAAAREHFTR